MTPADVANVLLFVIGVVVWLLGWRESARWIYLAAALVGGFPLFLFAAKGLFLRGDITAGVRATIAVSAAIIVGEYAAAALVVFMMAIGEWLENFTVARADRALQDLSKLVPAQVRVKRDGQEQLLPLAEVMLDDIVLAKTGERPARWHCAERQRILNQSAITGIHAGREGRGRVYAGTMNEVGYLEIRVTRL